MKFSKLKKVHVIIIGIVLCLIAGGAMYYFPIRNAQLNLKTQTDRYNAAVSAGGTPAAVAQAEAGFHQAVQDAALAEQKWNVYRSAKMPNLNLSDRSYGMLAIWKEQCQVLGPLLASWINNSGVKLTSSISIPAPPTNPNDPKLIVTGSQFMEYDLGKVTVEGSFKAIMNHLRKWNSCNRLVMIDTPSLSGQSPNLVCEYSLKVFIAPSATSSDKAVEMAGQGGAAGGMTPGATGMPGGFAAPAGR